MKESASYKTNNWKKCDWKSIKEVLKLLPIEHRDVLLSVYKLPYRSQSLIKGDFIHRGKRVEYCNDQVNSALRALRKLPREVRVQLNENTNTLYH